VGLRRRWEVFPDSRNLDSTPLIPNLPRRHALTAAAYLTCAALTLAIGAAGALPRRWAVTLAVSLALTGLIQGTRQWIVFNRRRNEADHWLRLAARLPPPSSAYAPRAAELVSRRERRQLAGSIQSAVREARGKDRYPVLSPLNRRAVRIHARELTELAERLADLDQPVLPAGILLVHDLLTLPSSPLYERAHADELTSTVSRILAALDPP
jgi:hypothetical protein